MNLLLPNAIFLLQEGGEMRWYCIRFYSLFLFSLTGLGLVDSAQKYLLIKITNIFKVRTSWIDNPCLYWSRWVITRILTTTIDTFHGLRIQVATMSRLPAEVSLTPSTHLCNVPKTQALETLIARGIKAITLSLWMSVLIFSGRVVL